MLVIIFIILTLGLTVSLFLLYNKNKNSSDISVNRCDDISVYPALNSVTGKDFASSDTKDPETYLGCKGDAGRGGEFAFCGGITRGDCDFESSKKLSDIKKYYGKTDKFNVDESSKYYKDVEKVMKKVRNLLSQMESYINNLTIQGIIPVITFDQDDTIWNCYAAAAAYEKPFQWDGKVFSEYSVNPWMPKINVVLDFFKELKEKGVLAVFVTGRSTNEDKVKETRMQIDQMGLTKDLDFWGGNIEQGSSGDPRFEEVTAIDGVFLRGERSDKQYRSASLFKEATRCYIETYGLDVPVASTGGRVNKQAKIIMSVGDQWSDSNGSCSGVKVKLPNPLYYLP